MLDIAPKSRICRYNLFDLGQNLVLDTIENAEEVYKKMLSRTKS